jgi:hypothetical protein
VSSAHPEPDGDVARQVDRVLTKLKVARGTTRGGTLLTEPMIVAYGRPDDRLDRPRFRDLTLVDQDGRQLGSGAPTYREENWDHGYELRDADERLVLTVRDLQYRRPASEIRAEIRRASPMDAPAQWELVEPDGTIIARRHVTRPAGRRRGGWYFPITEGPREIGRLRARSRVVGFGGRVVCQLEDESGDVLVRVLHTHGRKWARQKRAWVVLEIQNHTPVKLRKFALATGAMAREMLLLGPV